MQHLSVVMLCRHHEQPASQMEAITGCGRHLHFCRTTWGAATFKPVSELTFQLLGKTPDLAGLCRLSNPRPALCQPGMTPAPEDSGPVCWAALSCLC